MTISYQSFASELQKLAGGEKYRVSKRLDYILAPDSGSDKWTKFERGAKNPEFIKQLTDRPGVDPKLVNYAQGLHQLSQAEIVTKVPSSSSHGKTYEIRKMPDGSYGCTCNDWKFHGALNPGYRCKHIKQLVSRGGR